MSVPHNFDGLAMSGLGFSVAPLIIPIAQCSLCLVITDTVIITFLNCYTAANSCPGKYQTRCTTLITFFLPGNLLQRSRPISVSTMNRMYHLHSRPILF